MTSPRYGVDYSMSRPGATALRAAGYTFACRYLAGKTAGKALTKAEADQLRAGGVDLVSNWEVAAQAALGGHAQGVTDAKAAAAAHLAAGGPAGRPIYFSADWDATEAQQSAINAYFDGVASVIGLARTGAYGGYYVIKRLFDAGKIRWGWQTYAWSGGQWDTRAQLRQIQNGITVAGADCDRDQAMADDFGQWGYVAPLAPTPSEDIMGVIAKDAAGQYYHCIGGFSFPLTTAQVADVRYLAEQGVYTLATGSATDTKEWTDGGKTRLGWQAPTFGPVYQPPATVTVSAQDIAAALIAQLGGKS